jgi:hypothetical protein
MMSEVSSKTITAQVKRDLKALERLLKHGGFEAFGDAWLISNSLSACIGILMGRAVENKQ